jgi:hypothetical protein
VDPFEGREGLRFRPNFGWSFQGCHAAQSTGFTLRAEYVPSNPLTRQSYKRFKRSLTHNRDSKKF